MFLLQIAQVPVEAELSDGRKLSIPKMPMSEILIWGEEIMVERAERVTSDLDEVQMREYFTFYPSIPPDLRELRGLLRTVPGVKRVLESCLPKATVTDGKGQPLPNLTPEEITRLVGGGVGPLAVVAWALSDLDETQAFKKEPPKGEDHNEGNDPLTKSGKPGSKTSAMTGRKTMRSGEQSTPALNQGNVQ